MLRYSRSGGRHSFRYGGSGGTLLGAFMEEFKTIMTNFPAVKIELIIADAKVHAHYTFQGGER